MINAQNLATALRRMGYAVAVFGNENNVNGTDGTGREVRFYRTKASDSFTTRDRLPVGIEKSYAEIGVRSWAKSNGYSVTESNNGKMTLVNRSK